jgi:hypothetical protein
MQVHSKTCGAAIIMSLGALLFSSSSTADVLACRTERGAVTYTNGDCAQNAQVRVVIYEPRVQMEPEPPRFVMRETSWSRPLKVKNRRPDLAAIREAKLELQRMDDARKHKRSFASNGTQLAEYRE